MNSLQQEEIKNQNIDYGKYRFNGGAQVRFILIGALPLQGYSSPYDILLSKVNMKPLFIRRLQNFMITLYKSLFFMNYPGYLKDMFTLRSSS